LERVSGVSYVLGMSCKLKGFFFFIQKHFVLCTENFQKEVGSQIHRPAGARENPLYDALWVVQAMLRSGYYCLSYVFFVFSFPENLRCSLLDCHDRIFLMLRTSKNVAKNVMLFTNNDDPFGDADASVRQDMRRTTIQRAKVRLHFFLC
jgi:ATP-dependent DNA helicase 2 subunit 1